MGEVREGDLLAGKYRVERVLGEGGMGVVVAATHIQLQQRVALKFMRGDAHRDAHAAERFMREARAVVRLRSQHVARVMDVGTLERGEPYIVMEYLDGCDLGTLLESRGKLTVAQAADFILQASEAIAEAHAQGIVHRDLKPQNLFVTRGPTGAQLVKVLDFGISKASTIHETASSLTKTNAVLGSPSYMSPEQMRSTRNVDARSDIWSLGVILYELVGGRKPFEGETLGDLFARVFSESPAPLATLALDVPAAFAEVVARCLEKEPAKRFANVAELAHALAPFAPANARVAVAHIDLALGATEPPPAETRPDVPPLSIPRAPSVPQGMAAHGAADHVATGASWDASPDAAAQRARKAKRARAMIAGALAAAACAFGVFLVMREPKSSSIVVAPAGTSSSAGSAIVLAAAAASSASAPPSATAQPTTNAPQASSAPEPPAADAGSAATKSPPAAKPSARTNVAAPTKPPPKKNVLDDWN